MYCFLGGSSWGNGGSELALPLGLNVVGLGGWNKEVDEEVDGWFFKKKRGGGGGSDRSVYVK